jgi:hypothetical protein
MSSERGVDRDRESAVKGHIDFEYDSTNDVVIATPHWLIEDESDVQEWYAQYERYFRRFGRKVDAVMVLDDFEIKTAIGPRWGEARARLLNTFTVRSFRVHATAKVQTFTNTSGARYNAATQEAPTVADAIEGIKAARRAEQRSS